MSGETRVVDARGMLCPWPVIRLSREAREIGAGTLRVLADDPAAPREIASFCEERGWRYSTDDQDKNAFHVVIG